MTTAATTLLRHLHTLAARQTACSLSDQQLLERFLRERSEVSFAALVQRHGSMVLGVCRRVLRHTQDAEDAFQATFLVLARKAQSIRKQDSLSSWLHGVAYHVAQRQKAKMMRRSLHERKLVTRPATDALEDITWRELRAVLDEELQRLPERYRAPLVLCYLEARTQDEAARRLGWSRNTFFRRLSRARELLAQRLKHRGLTLTAALTAPLLLENVATVPSSLAANTVRAGLAVANGQMATGLAASHVLTLASEGAKMLPASKVKAALILLAALAIATGGVFAHRTLGVSPIAAQPSISAPPRPEVPSHDRDRTTEIKGRVLYPDGKPIVGANVYLWIGGMQTKADKRVCATTGADGCFRFPIGKDDRLRLAKIVAIAKDYGPDWMELSKLKDGEEVILRLVKDDVPIRGRILDLEGKPVANASVRVLELHQADLDKLMKLLTKGDRYFSYPKSIEAKALNTAAQTTTGADGRFQLRGFGRERLVHLEISGETIERVRCFVMTRAGVADLKHGEPAYYPASFDHIASPTKPIVGTVREKGTGKPLAGITVGYWINTTTTDSHGKYRLVGIAKQRDYGIRAAGTPYFAALKSGIADTPGFDPITVDFELERGIEIRGRVINKATGEPIKADVSYHALSDNPHLKKVSGLDQGYFADRRGYTEADGAFFVVGLPGPGCLVVLADEDDYHKVGKPADGEKVVPYVNFAPPLVHAWVRINPSENEPKSLRCDIALDPAKPIPGEVRDPDGKPLGGYFVTGLTGSPRHHSYETLRHEKSSFQVRGFDRDRPRTLVFFHPDKKLGKVQLVREAPHGSLLVPLAPLSVVTGRILDARGRPWAGLQVHARISQKPEDNPLELLFDGQWRKRVEAQGTTDASGKFRLDGLMPGLKYTLEVREGDGNASLELLPSPDSWAAAESGKTKDLGDLKSKLVPREPSKK